MRTRILHTITPAVCGVFLAATVASAAAPENLLKTIQSVGREGQGNARAKQAVQKLIRRDADVLPHILQAFDDTGPLSANWLRSAFEAIADRAVENGKGLPADKLQAFIRNRDNDPRARTLAFEWLVKVDPDARKRLVPGMIDDPSPYLRRLAVARLIDRAEKLQEQDKQQEAKRVYQEALAGAIHKDQVETIVKPLRKMGEKIDLQQHFGFLTEWHVIGPFDNHDEKGFAVPYPPEEEVNLDAEYRAEYQGEQRVVRWQPVSTDHKYGLVDIAKQIENYKGSCMYFTTEFWSPKRRKVEFRLGTPNSWKLWLNGEYLFGREEYHRGMAMDQYTVEATLQPGRNVILFKICQNEQKQDWAQRYQFQMRVCDPSGRAVHSQPPETAGSTGSE